MNVQSSSPQTFSCSMSCSAPGAAVASCPVPGAMLCLSSLLLTAALPQVCPQVTRLAVRSEGSGWQDAAGVGWCSCKGQLSPRASEEGLQLPLCHGNPLCICSITAASAPETPLLLPGTVPRGFPKGTFLPGAAGPVQNHCSPPKHWGGKGHTALLASTGALVLAGVLFLIRR